MTTLELGLLKCDCGAPAKSLCGDHPSCTLAIRCMKPVCGSDGGYNCTKHRHRNGTMGYPEWNAHVARWEGYAPDGPGIWEGLRALWLTWTMTAKQAATRAFIDARKQFPPPAPLPPLRIVVGKRVFEMEGDEVFEVFGPKDWHKELLDKSKRERN